MLGGGVAFALVINLVRLASETQHTFEIAFFRSLFGFAAMLPWLWRAGWGGLQTERLPLHVGRAGLTFVSMCLWFWTLAILPLAEATAISFTAPIFAMVLAALFLGEQLYRSRWIATALAVLGGLIIVQPGMHAFEPMAVIAVLTALMWGSGTVLVKALSRTETSAAIVCYQSLITLPVSLLPALFVWRTPTLFELAVMAGVGLSASLGHYCVSRAMKLADAGFLVIFDYMRLPIVAFFAFVLFDEVPSLAVLAGAVMIAGGAIYGSRHQTALQAAPIRSTVRE